MPTLKLYRKSSGKASRYGTGYKIRENIDEYRDYLDR
jgi:hypothetical protein